MNSFLLRYNWGLLWKDIWATLGKKTYAPDDMFNELYGYECRKLKLKASEEALNDPKLAKKEFKRLVVPHDERTCIVLLEGFFETLSDFKEERVSCDYRNLLEKFIEQHNLRYFLTQDCKIRLSLSGLIVSQYETLKKAVSDKPLRKHSLISLEKNVGLFNDVAEENCIRVANNLLEGVLMDKANVGSDKFSDNLDGCRNCFPHEALLESARKFYKFSNDYPNLRHGGKEKNPMQIRDIKKDDAILALSFTILLASFIANNDAGQSILSGDF